MTSHFFRGYFTSTLIQAPPPVFLPLYSCSTSFPMRASSLPLPTSPGAWMWQISCSQCSGRTGMKNEELLCTRQLSYKRYGGWCGEGELGIGRCAILTNFPCGCFPVLKHWGNWHLYVGPAGRISSEDLVLFIIKWLCLISLIHTLLLFWALL